MRFTAAWQWTDTLMGNRLVLECRSKSSKSLLLLPLAAYLLVALPSFLMSILPPYSYHYSQHSFSLSYPIRPGYRCAGLGIEVA